MAYQIKVASEFEYKRCVAYDIIMFDIKWVSRKEPPAGFSVVSAFGDSGSLLAAF
jgi:hypothetical protein